MSGYPSSLRKGGVGCYFTVFALIGLVSACAHTSSPSPPTAERVEGNRALPGEQLCRNDESLLNLLGLLDDFNRADTGGRTTIYEQVSTAAVLEPTTANRLALAMLKATPGHHGYNLESAQALLNTVLDDSNMLSTSAIRFARLYAGAIAEQHKLVQRNRQLRAELTDAKGKLEALTEIEREVDLTVPDAQKPGDKQQSPPESGLKSNSKRVSQHGEPQKNSTGR